MENVSRMKELISRLNQAAKVYYQGQGEVMSNFEYDKLYDELLALEKETGITMNNSLTQYEVIHKCRRKKNGKNTHAFSTSFSSSSSSSLFVALGIFSLF